MSGIAERIVEDWLTNADERGYQASFIVSLIRQKHRVKYVSAHTVLEHGKDVISVSPTGELSAYQLKAGNIGLSAWRDMRGEVEELVLVPVTAGAGVKPRIADRAYLVTSGRVSDPARHQIELINAENQSLGRPTIELIERDELLGEFLSLFETFLPSGVPDAASVVALTAADGRGRPSGKELFPLFSAIAGSAVSRTRLRRASSELVAAAEFVSAPYRRAGNRISVIDVWVLAAAVLAKISLGGEVQRRAVRQGLDLVEMAVDEAADDLWAEVNESEDFLGGLGGRADSAAPQTARARILRRTNQLAGLARSRGPRRFRDSGGDSAETHPGNALGRGGLEPVDQPRVGDAAHAVGGIDG